MNLDNSPLPSTQKQPPVAKKPNYLLWVLSGIIGLIFLLIIAAIIIAANLIISSAKNLPNWNSLQNAPPAEIVPPPTTITDHAPRFATDPAILSLSSNLKELRAEIDAVDIFETQLSPPSLDLNIRVTIAP